jgi:cysteine-rich repeat protein
MCIKRHTGPFLAILCAVLGAALGSLTIVGCGGRVEEAAAHDVPGLGGNTSAAPFSSIQGGLGGNTTDPTVKGSGGANSTGGTDSRRTVRCPAGNLVVVTGPACGDGLLDVGEKCDDGNVNPGDGCNARCLIEPGWSCPDVGTPCLPCSNCKMDPGEGCDDGNTKSGDGCSNRCQVETGFRCDLPLYMCFSTGECGDGALTLLSEACDDGNSRGGDGCSADCKTVEPGFLCKVHGQSCERVTATKPHCGDGQVQTNEGETCDDGANDGRYGGCSADCMTPFCGDGQVQPGYGEFCDEGPNNVGEYLGCTPDCKYLTFPEPPDCSKYSSPACGDGQVQSEFGETCDDGINDGLLGHCTPKCTIGPGGFCGDGNVNPEQEECDDGNWNSCDGCSSRCQREMTP